MRRLRLTDRAVVSVYSATVAVSVVISAAQAAFWHRQHDTAPVAALVLLLLACALMLRQRWAWWFFLIISLAGLPSFIVYVSTHVRWATVTELLAGFVELGLLLSNPMRRYMGIRGRLRARNAQPASSL